MFACGLCSLIVVWILWFDDFISSCMAVKCLRSVAFVAGLSVCCVVISLLLFSVG